MRVCLYVCVCDRERDRDRCMEIVGEKRRKRMTSVRCVVGGRAGAHCDVLV